MKNIYAVAQIMDVIILFWNGAYFRSKIGENQVCH